MKRRPRGYYHSTRITLPVAFRTFGDVRPLLNRYVLPVYSDPGMPPWEIVCDSMAAALAHTDRLREADLADFEPVVSNRSIRRPARYLP